MKRPAVWIAAALALAIGLAVLVRRAMNSEDRQIRKALHELVEQAQLTEKENPVQAGLRSRAIGDAFTEDVSVGTPVFRQHIDDRVSLVALAFRARTNLDSVQLKVYDVDVELSDDGTTAAMMLSFNVQVRGMGGSDEMWRDLAIDWRKEDGRWLIAAAETVETIRGP